MVCIYTKKLCPSQIFVHQTCVCFVFFISDLPISSTNTPENSPLATCDDSKFQDIEKQLRDSDKNPVGLHRWMGWMSKFPWQCLSTRKWCRILRPWKIPCEKMNSLPLFFEGFLAVACPLSFMWVSHKVFPAARSVDLRSHLQAVWGPSNRQWWFLNPDAQVTNWQVRNSPFLLGLGRAFYCAFSRNLFGGKVPLHRMHVRHLSPHNFEIQEELHDESPISSTI